MKWHEENSAGKEFTGILYYIIIYSRAGLQEAAGCKSGLPAPRSMLEADY